MFLRSILFVNFLLVWMVIGTTEKCDFSVVGIQKIVDNLENFKQTLAFFTLDASQAVTKFTQYDPFGDLNVFE